MEWRKSCDTGKENSLKNNFSGHPEMPRKWLGFPSDRNKYIQRECKNQLFPWCSFLVATLCFHLSHLACLWAELCENQMMLWINDIPAGHLEGLFPLIYVLSLLLGFRVKASLPPTPHSAVALLLQLIAVSFLLLKDSPAHLHFIISCPLLSA